MVNKQTPTQIAKELMKGCGILHSFWDVRCGSFEDLKHSDHYVYCDNCKSKILAYKTAWTNELEFLGEIRTTLGLFEFYESNTVQDRISELTKALKILDGGQA